MSPDRAKLTPDGKYIISLPPQPEPTEKPPHQRDFWVSIAALIVAFIAGIFAAWQAYEAREARIEAREAANAQAEDVERSRKAAEDSAAAAKALANAALKNLTVTERNARAAESSATAARTSVAESRAAFRTSTRAYMVLHDMRLLKPLFPSGEVHARVRYMNVGRTPAMNVDATLNLRVEDYPLTVLTEPPAEMKLGTITIGSDLDHTTSSASHTPLEAYKLDAIKKGTHALVVLGTIKYRDIFGESHTTTICGFWSEATKNAAVLRRAPELTHLCYRRMTQAVCS